MSRNIRRLRRSTDPYGTDQQVEQWIGTLLQRGVFAATVVVAIGGILYLTRHGLEAPDYHFFRGEPPLFRSPEGVVQAVLAGRYRGIIQFGLMMLIATPIARVLLALVIFTRQQDKLYIAITLAVLTGLSLSLFTGRS